MTKGIFILSLLLFIGCAEGPNPNRSKGNPIDHRSFDMVFEVADDSAISQLWVYNFENDSTWRLTESSSREAQPTIWNDTILTYLIAENEQWVRKGINIRTGEEANVLTGLFEGQTLQRSPNKQMIAGTQTIEDTTHIFLARSDGKRVQWLTKGHGGGQSPKWSPDGLTLLYESEKDGNSELYIFQLTTAYERRVTQNNSLDRDAVWHPKGESIAFLSSRSGPQAEVFMKNLATGKTRQLTNNTLIKGSCIFSPNGQLLYYTAKENEGPFQLYGYRLANDSSFLVATPNGSISNLAWILKAGS